MTETHMLLPLLLLLLAPICAVALCRWLHIAGRDRWHKRHQHSCGYHTDFKLDHVWTCGGCGKCDAKWTNIIARAHMLGWEFMEPKK